MKTCAELGRAPFETLPERWCIERTKNTADLINRVIDQLFFNGVKTHIMKFGYIHSKPVTFGHQNWHSLTEDRTGKQKADGFTEITMTEFVQFVIMPNKSKLTGIMVETTLDIAMAEKKAQMDKQAKALGLRYNDGKLPWHLVDFQALEPMVRVLEYGASKYDPHNWKQGMPHAEIADCLLRHLFAWIHGEDNDQESGLSHLGHVLCNAMFLTYNVKHHPELDNRYKLDKK